MFMAEVKQTVVTEAVVTEAVVGEAVVDEAVVDEATSPCPIDKHNTSLTDYKRQLAISVSRIA